MTVFCLPVSILRRRPVRAAPAWLAVAGLGVLVSAGPAAAQGPDVNSLLNRLNRLETEVQTLNRQVFRGPSAAPAEGGAAGAPTALAPGYAANVEVRLGQLETELRNLTGRFEEIAYSLSQLQERLDKLASDVDFRLSRIEAGNPGADVAGAPPPGAAPAAPPQPGPEAAAEAPSIAAAPAAPPTQEATAPAVATLPSGGPQEQYDHAFGLLRRAQWAQAEQALRQFLEQHPDHRLAANAQYWLGETYYVRGNFAEAAVAFAEGFQKFPDGPKAADNLLKLGMSLAALNQKEDACLTLGQLLTEFPNAPQMVRRRAEEERSRLGCS